MWTGVNKNEVERVSCCSRKSENEGGMRQREEMSRNRQEQFGQVLVGSLWGWRTAVWVCVVLTSAGGGGRP